MILTMRNTSRDDLNRAVSILNFEQENMSMAKKVLRAKYDIPQFHLSQIMHKIFHRLGTYDSTWPPKNYTSIWDQFHQIASEEVKTLNFQH